MMWQAWTNAGVGLWLIIAAFLQMNRIDYVMNNLIIGSIALTVGWLMKAARPLHGWSSMTLGLSLIASLLFVEPIGEGGRRWILVIIGMLLAILGLTALAGNGPLATYTSQDQQRWNHGKQG